MGVTSANRYLTRSEMEGNAEVIASVFLANGWSVNAIAAMLGNMQSESGINPGIYENLDDTSTTNGFGLVQWTPNTKYKEWADANGYGSDYGDIFNQTIRIRYEVANGLQWISTTAYPLTFKEFTTSGKSPEYLAQAFLYNYERPASLDQPARSTQAREWYDFILNLYPDAPTPSEPDEPTPTGKKEMSKLLLYFAGTRRR